MAACWNLYVFLPFSVFISVFSPFSATFQKTAPCLSSKDLELSALLLCILNTMFHSIGRLHTLDSTIGMCVSVCACLNVCLLHTDTKFITNIDFLPEGWTPDMKSYWSFKYNTHAFFYETVSEQLAFVIYVLKEGVYCMCVL